MNDSSDSESTCFVAANGTKLWIPKCDDKHKPYLNQHFLTLDDEYDFYYEYGCICNFDVRKSTKKTNSHGYLRAKYIVYNRGGSPYKHKSKLVDDHVVEGSHTRRRTISCRCNCQARIVLKPVGVKGFVVISFIEEHNHPLATGASRMFLRCNRNLSVAHQNLIMDCLRANIGVIKSHSLAK